MDVTITIPEEVASKLKERAAVSGETIPAYTAKLVAETVAKPNIDEVLAPVRADFARTGMDDAQAMDFGRELLNGVRREKNEK